jgi:hypothetical protein
LLDRDLAPDERKIVDSPALAGCSSCAVDLIDGNGRVYISGLLDK